MSEAKRPGAAVFIDAVGLALATLVVFITAVRFGFLAFDDDLFLTENPAVAPGLTADTIAWAFRSTYLGMWHPLTWLSYLLDVSLYGLRPAGHHFTSVALHALNGGLCLLVLRGFGLSRGQALLAAALFALHPMRAESVAWLSERKDVLCGTFFFLTLLAWQRYLRLGHGRSLVLVVALYGMALMSKSMAVTLPVLLLLVDEWTRRPTPWARRVTEKVPLFLMSLGSGVTTIWAQHAAGAIRGTQGLSIAARFSTVPLAYARYLEKTFWPQHLYCHYNRYQFALWQLAGAAVVLLGVVAIAVAMRRRAPHLLPGLVWFLVVLAPVIGLLQAGGQLLADRYTYLAHPGLFAGLVLSVPATWRVKVAQVRLVALGLLGALATLTFFQLQTWADTDTVLGHALEQEPNSAFLQHAMGLQLIRTGRSADAVPLLQACAGLMPDARSHLGLALRNTGRLPEAVTELRRAVAETPEDVPTWSRLAHVEAEAGHLPESLVAFREFEARTADGAAGREAGQVLLAVGRAEEALPWLRRAVAREPTDGETRALLGSAEAQAGHLQEALATLEEAARLLPGSPEVARLLANVRHDLKK